MIYIQSYGPDIAVGISDTKEEVERITNIFYNTKITDNLPIWISDTFAYVLTDEDRLAKGMETKCLVELQQTAASKRVIRNGKRVSLLPFLAKQKALEEISQFIKEIFIFEEPGCNDTFDMGII